MSRSFLLATGIACLFTFAIVWFATGAVRLRGVPETAAPAAAVAEAVSQDPPKLVSILPKPIPAGPPPIIVPDPGPPVREHEGDPVG